VLRGRADRAGRSAGLLHWDGRFLPGTWLITQTIEAAATRLANTPVIAVVIRLAHHVAALVAYLRIATERGLVLLILNSDPSSKTVAAHGGLDRQLPPIRSLSAIPQQAIRC
jgi:LDH2 family malate/lactate/ureidoglycolate dehydrogenase